MFFFEKPAEPGKNLPVGMKQVAHSESRLHILGRAFDCLRCSPMDSKASQEQYTLSYKNSTLLLHHRSCGVFDLLGKRGLGVSVKMRGRAAKARPDWFIRPSHSKAVSHPPEEVSERRFIVVTGARTSPSRRRACHPQEASRDLVKGVEVADPGHASYSIDRRHGWNGRNRRHARHAWDRRQLE